MRYEELMVGTTREGMASMLETSTLQSIASSFGVDDVAHIYEFKGPVLGVGHGDVKVIVVGKSSADCSAIYDAIDLGLEAINQKS